MEDYKKMYEELKKEFEQYKKESIKWSRYDILDHGLEGYRITERQAQDTLEAMIKNHNKLQKEMNNQLKIQWPQE